MSFVEIEPYLYYLLILLFLMGVPNSLHTPFSSSKQTHLLFQWNKSMENNIKTEDKKKKKRFCLWPSFLNISNRIWMIRLRE